MDAQNPWEDPRFNQQFYGFVMDLPMGMLRLHCTTYSLISALQLTTLSAMEQRGPLVHNQKILDYIRPGAAKSYEKFLQIVEEMGYPDKVKEMKSLLR